jgi:hypothetical protein
VNTHPIHRENEIMALVVAVVAVVGVAAAV